MRDAVKDWVFVALILAIWVVALMFFTQGCTVARTADGMSVSFLQLSPSDEIQTTAITTVGLYLRPADGSVSLGYVRTQASRIPTYDIGTVVPDVRIETSVDTGPYIIESLAVGQLTDETDPGVLGRLFGGKN